MSSYLTSNFLDEIFRLAFTKKAMLEVLKAHLKFQYIPKELQEYKLILQSIINQYDLSGKLPSYGVISQQHPINAELHNALQKIKNSEVIDMELAMRQLFEYIKDVKFQLIFDSSVEKYNDGKKDEALKIFMDGASEIQNFSLKGVGRQFLRVFEDFDYQMRERQVEFSSGEDTKQKVPFGMDMLDSISDGGMDSGETALWIMPSGVGKSTALKWTGMYCCRLDYDILHIQLEGSKREAYDKYSQVWTGLTYKEARHGDISDKKLEKIEKAVKSMKDKQKDIDIYSFEKYGSVSMLDVRLIVLEYYKLYGRFPSLIVIDSLDLLITGENAKIDMDPAYKKERMQLVAQRMKDLAVEFGTRILTVTQTSNIPKEKWNNPDFVITRENTESDRTLVKTFSFVFTGNQTTDERKKGIMRLYIDKMRYYDPKDQIYPFATAYNVGKFYDRKRSIDEFADLYVK